MLNLFVILALLLLYPTTTNGLRDRFRLKQYIDRTMQNPERVCAGMVNLEFVRICTQKYQREIVLKYGDNMLVTGEPFSVFHQPENTSHFFVTFKLSPLHRCKNLFVKRENEFYCNRDNNSISLKKTMMFCYAMHMQVVDDILAQCLLKIESTKFYPKSEFVSLHYTMSNAETNQPHPFVELIVMLIFISKVYLLLVHIVLILVVAHNNNKIIRFFIT